MPKVLVNMFVHFGLLESISDELKTRGRDQNFVLFSNIGSEILSIFFQEY
jgi:hypothetical protein